MTPAQTLPDPRVLLTPAEVAEILRMPVKWVLEHSTRRLPLLPSLKLGKYRTNVGEGFVESAQEKFENRCRIYFRRKAQKELSMPITFEDYLEGCLNRAVPVIDHSLRAERLPDGRIKFYIHPSNTDGDTPDFVVSGNVLLRWPDDNSE